MTTGTLFVAVAVCAVALTLARAPVDVHVSAVLDLTGHVRYARAVDGPADLQAAAVAAVSQWTYTPAMIYKTPVPIAMAVSVPFHADRRSQ
jgi:hypothetical protein